VAQFKNFSLETEGTILFYFAFIVKGEDEIKIKFWI